MAGNRRQEGHPRWSDVMQSIGTALLALTSIVGLIYISHELAEFRRQNNYLERTLHQAYRPLGVANYGGEKNSQQIIIGYIDGAKPGKFSFGCNSNFYNRGKGVLSYIGSFSYLSTSEKDFRRCFLAGQVDSVNFDALYSYARRTPIQPDDCIPVFAQWLNISFEEKYFLYALFLYEDQDGGLYDTERLDVLVFQSKPSITDKGLQPKLIGGYCKEKYHSYSLDEKRALIKEIRRKQHALADALETGY